MSMDVKPNVPVPQPSNPNGNWEKPDPVQTAREALQAYLRSLERAESKQMAPAPQKPTADQKTGAKSPTATNKSLPAAEDDDRWNVFSPHPVRRNTIHTLDPKALAAAVAAAGPLRRGSAMPRLQQRPTSTPPLSNPPPNAGPMNVSSANARMISTPLSPSTSSSSLHQQANGPKNVGPTSAPAQAQAPAPAPAPASVPASDSNEMFSPRRKSIH